jgi:hypothetical protein
MGQSRQKAIPGGKADCRHCPFPVPSLQTNRFDLRDDALCLQEVAARGRDAFFAEVVEAMRAAQESGGAAHALFCLHDYNVSFEDAALRKSATT